MLKSEDLSKHIVQVAAYSMEHLEPVKCLSLIIFK